MKILTNLFLFSVGGVLAGFISLIFLAIIPMPHFESGYVSTILTSLVEEIIKLTILLFITMSLVSLSKFKHYVYLAVAFGLGFSLFELFLVLVSQTYLLNYTFLLTTIIHIVTSILLSILAYSYHNQQNQVLTSQKLSTKLVILFVLAFFIHLCYNLIVLRN